jgi:hypothetical protein
MIKKTFISDVSKIDDKLNEIKRNLKYIIYNDDTEIDRICKLINSEALFYNTFLSNINYSQEELEDKIDNTKKTKLINHYKNNMAAIEEILNVYAEYILEFRKIIVDLFNSVGYCNISSVINIDQKLNDYYKKVFIKNENITDDNYLAFRFKEPAEEPYINIYKKKLLEQMKRVNNLFVIKFNTIKYLMVTAITAEVQTNNKKNIIGEIKNNYNVFNKDNKYTYQELIKKPFKLQCNYTNKFNKFSLKDKTEQEINMNNVSWSFIILVIIFAIILLEPTII